MSKRTKKKGGEPVKEADDKGKVRAGFKSLPSNAKSKAQQEKVMSNASAEDRSLKEGVQSILKDGIGLKKKGMSDHHRSETYARGVQPHTKANPAVKKPPTATNGTKRKLDNATLLSPTEPTPHARVDTEEVDLFMQSISDASNHGKLRLDPRPDWFHYCPAHINPTGDFNQSADLMEKAYSALQTENEVYSSSVLPKSRDRHFLTQIISSGTLNDKIGALTLMIQESPLHTMRSLEVLVSMAKKKNRNQSIQSIAALKDLFVSTVLPDRKLRRFEDSCSSIDPKSLLVWAFEDWLRKQYLNFLKMVEELSMDHLSYSRSNTLKVLSDLLIAKPEQESILLRLLVNKLGDSDRKIASKTSYQILQVENVHPAMKEIIISSIEELLFRPNAGHHAHYYSMIALNQTLLTSDNAKVANKLIDIYFTFFQKVVIQWKPSEPVEKKEGKISKKALRRMKEDEKAAEQREEHNTKLVSAVLTGVNRAFPFSGLSAEDFQKHMDSIFRITHSGSFNTSIQALVLIWQVTSSSGIALDRFYRSLYASLNDPRLVRSSKHTIYLNLLFRAIKNDPDVARAKAFIKRLLHICGMQHPSFVVGSLFLLMKLESTLVGIRGMMTQPEEMEDETYDGRTREPLHSNASKTCLWELLPFTKHFHPTISLYADRCLAHQNIPSKPALADFSFSHFLDRFVYRSAKNKTPLRGASIMQPLVGGITDRLVSKETQEMNGIPVNSEQFLERKKDNIPPDVAFFHQYFAGKRAPQASAQKEKPKRENNEELEEEEIWSALVKSRPDVDPDVDNESDLEGMDLSVSDLSDVASDADDLLGDDSEEVDSETPVDDSLQMQESLEEESHVPSENEGTGASEVTESKRSKRRKMNQLPTFASVDEYAHLLSD